MRRLIGPGGAPPDPTALKSARRILVIRLRYLGDLVLTQSVIRNLRLAYPDAEVWMLTDDRFADFVRDCGLVDGVLEAPRARTPGRKGRPMALRWLQLVADVRARKFDLVIDVYCSRTSRWLSWLTGARLRIDTPQDHPDSLHYLDRYLSVLPVLDAPLAERTPRISASAHTEAATIRTLADLGLEDRRYAVIHPGASKAERRWPPERFGAVIDHLMEVHGLPTLALCGPGEESALAAAVASCRHRPKTLDQQGSTSDMLSLIAHSTLFIGNESGPMHVAAASGARVIALFGSQRPGKWGPIGEKHLVVRPPMLCGEACLRPEACQPPEGTNYCVGRNTIAEVIAAVDTQLSEIRKETSP